MMIADLVDQDDFYQLLQSVGIPVEAHWTSEQCAQVALKWRCDNNQSNTEMVVEFDRIIAELKHKEPLLLPEVKAALQMLI